MYKETLVLEYLEIDMQFESIAETIFKSIDSINYSHFMNRQKKKKISFPM